MMIQTEDFGKVVIRSMLDATEPANTALSDGVGDAQLASTLSELLIEHKIEPMHPFNGPEGEVFAEI